MQETWVWSPLWEDPTYHGAPKPMRHKYGACALESRSCNCWSHPPSSLFSATREATAVRSLHTPTRQQPLSQQLEKSPGSNKDQMQPKETNNFLRDKWQSGKIFSIYITKNKSPYYTKNCKLIRKDQWPKNNVAKARNSSQKKKCKWLKHI